MAQFTYSLPLVGALLFGTLLVPMACSSSNDDASPPDSSTAGSAGSSNAAGSAGSSSNGGAGGSSAKVPLGEPCSIMMNVDNCVDGAYCSRFDGTTETKSTVCRKRRQEGESCDSGMELSCVDGYRCTQNTKKCVKSTPVGSSCNVGFNDECGPGGYCDDSTNKCVPKSDVGEPCRPNGRGCTDGVCQYFSDDCLHGLACEPKPAHNGCFIWADCDGSMKSCCPDSSGNGVCKDGLHSCDGDAKVVGVCAPNKLF